MNVEITTYDKIIEGLNLTYKRLIEFKKSKNSPLVVSKDGKVVHLDPFTLEPLEKKQ